MSKNAANALCLFIAAIWGGGFIATDAALSTFDPFTVLLIRFAGASLVCWLMVLVKKVKIEKSTWIHGGISGLFLYLAFAFQTFGLAMTNTGQNAFLTSVNVVLVPYIIWLVFKQKPTWIQVFAGFVCLTGIGFMSLSDGGFSFSPGDLCSLVCAFFFACQIIALDRGAKNEDTNAINAVQMTVAALMAIPGALFLESFPAHISVTAVFSCIYMICIATWLAYQLQTVAQKYTDASSASLLLCTESLFANLFGYLILHEAKSVWMLLGGMLIFVSVILVESPSLLRQNRPLKRLSKE